MVAAAHVHEPTRFFALTPSSPWVVAARTMKEHAVETARISIGWFTTFLRICPRYSRATGYGCPGRKSQESLPAMMPQISAFPKCYIEQIAAERSMSVFDWIEM